MGRFVTTFPRRSEFEKAKAHLDALSLSYDVVSPEPGYAFVGVPGLVVEPETRMVLTRSCPDIIFSGWVEYRPAGTQVPDEEPPEFEEDIFGRAAIMLLAPCVPDAAKIRIITHISGDLTEVFPYLNAGMYQGSYNPNGPNFTFMDGCRMVTLYPRRIALSRMDEIVDAWRVLEMIRHRVNKVWARRDEIEPSYDIREKPPALEIYKRLPGTNCGRCGQPTCLAFAVKVYSGELSISMCKPVFDGEFIRLEDAVVEICAGLDVAE